MLDYFNVITPALIILALYFIPSMTDFNYSFRSYMKEKFTDIDIKTEPVSTFYFNIYALMGYLAIVAISIPFVPPHYIYYLIMTTHILFFSLAIVYSIVTAFLFSPTPDIDSSLGGIEYGVVFSIIDGLFISSSWWMIDSNYPMFFQAVFILNFFMILLVRNGVNSRYTYKLCPGNNLNVKGGKFSISGYYWDIRSVYSNTKDTVEDNIVYGTVHMKTTFYVVDTSKENIVVDEVLTLTPGGFDRFSTPWVGWFDYAIIPVLFTSGSQTN